MSTIPPGARDLLATGPLAHVVTLNPDGTPHVSLAWAGLDEDGVGIVWSSFSDQHKLDNLRRDPRISLSFEAPDSGGEPLHPYLVIRGRARIDEGCLTTLRAYQAGLFPMAETRGADKLFWLDPEQRGVLPLEGFHAPRRLLRTVLSDVYTVSVDTDFPAVIAACAQPGRGRDDTWINPQIEALFTALHRDEADLAKNKESGWLEGANIALDQLVAHVKTLK